MEKNMPGKIELLNDRMHVPDEPVIPFIEGDGIGVDITPAMRTVVDKAVERAYGARRRIEWFEVLAGEKGAREVGEVLPVATVERLREHVVGIKGPLTTPLGGGIRSVNVALRQILDLYSCIRPVRYYGAPSPLLHPADMDLVIFRENTEDVYAGVEFESGSAGARKIISHLREVGVDETRVREDAAVGIKPISPRASRRHIRKALRFALEHGCKSVTLMHKGNIMKYTEGAFMRWGYDVALEKEFRDHVVSESEIAPGDAGNKIVINDRIADNMFQQILTNTRKYDLIVTTNLNGDYISDAAAGCVGGLGMAPGANVGDGLAVFEATHGTAPGYAGQDKVNPSSLILSAAMMLEYLGWREAAELIQGSLRETLKRRMGTYDLIRGWRNLREGDVTELSCSEFAAALVDGLA
jgi:isocitrate dehydrogenase